MIADLCATFLCCLCSIGFDSILKLYPPACLLFSFPSMASSCMLTKFECTSIGFSLWNILCHRPLRYFGVSCLSMKAFYSNMVYLCYKHCQYIVMLTPNDISAIYQPIFSLMFWWFLHDFIGFFWQLFFWKYSDFVPSFCSFDVV